MITRISKAALTACMGVSAVLVGIDNIIAYDTNFAFVRHVLAMDTTFPGNVLKGRAITSESLHHAAYWLIIAAELVIGALCLLGSWRLARACPLSAQKFNRAKSMAVAGLTLGVLLYFGGFLVVGGEWFQMWQSQTWNGQESAFRFAAAFGLVLIFVAMEDADLWP